MKLSFLAFLSVVGLTIASPVPETAASKGSLQKRETALNAFLTVLLEYLPAIDDTISSLVDVLTDFEDLLVLITGDQDTYNELGGPCTEYTVIFARGTTEPGNVGILVGPPFFDALTSAAGTSSIFTFQGVNDYSASVDGYLEGGDPKGTAEMAAEISQAYSSCPSTKLVASGYSQGGQLVHNSIALLPAATAEWISKVVIFGDPDDGTAIANVAASKVDTYCHTGDNICVNGDLVLPAHLTYAENAAAAAAFVLS